MENLVSDKAPFRSLMSIFINVFLGFVFIGPMLGFGIASLVYEGDLLQATSFPETYPDAVPAVLLMQGVAAFVGLILFPYLHIRWVEKKPLARFFSLEEKTSVQLLISIFLGVSFMVAMSPVVEWNANISFPDFMSDFAAWARASEDRLIKFTEMITDFKSAGEFIIGILVIGILPGVGEELVFRGLIQNELNRATKNVHVAIWVSAFIFSAIHLQFFGFVPRLLLGALFGYLYYWSGNLLVPMFAHFFHNSFTLVMIYLDNQKIIETNMEENVSAPWPLVSVAAIVSFALLYFFRKSYRTGLTT
jgi:hypothetical protein